jgi:hypothetical protein
MTQTHYLEPNLQRSLTTDSDGRPFEDLVSRRVDDDLGSMNLIVVASTTEVRDLDSIGSLESLIDGLEKEVRESSASGEEEEERHDQRSLLPCLQEDNMTYLILLSHKLGGKPVCSFVKQTRALLGGAKGSAWAWRSSKVYETSGEVWDQEPDVEMGGES